MLGLRVCSDLHDCIILPPVSRMRVTLRDSKQVFAAIFRGALDGEGSYTKSFIILFVPLLTDTAFAALHRVHRPAARSAPRRSPTRNHRFITDLHPRRAGNEQSQFAGALRRRIAAERCLHRSERRAAFVRGHDLAQPHQRDTQRCFQRQMIRPRHAPLDLLDALR